MQNLVPSLIRTYVPLAIGALVSWLALFNVKLDEPTKVGLSAAVAGLASAVYYTLVRLLERKWPETSVFLGTVYSPVNYQTGVQAATAKAAIVPTEAPALSVPVVPDVLPVETPTAPAVSFAEVQAKIDAAINGTTTAPETAPAVPTA